MKVFSFIAVLAWALSSTAGFVLVRSWCVEAQNALARERHAEYLRKNMQDAAEDACVKDLKDATEVADNCVFALRKCVGVSP